MSTNTLKYVQSSKKQNTHMIHTSEHKGKAQKNVTPRNSNKVDVSTLNLSVECHKVHLIKHRRLKTKTQWQTQLHFIESETGNHSSFEFYAGHPAYDIAYATAP